MNWNKYRRNLMSTAIITIFLLFTFVAIIPQVFPNSPLNNIIPKIPQVTASTSLVQQAFGFCNGNSPSGAQLSGTCAATAYATTSETLTMTFVSSVVAGHYLVYIVAYQSFPNSCNLVCSSVGISGVTDSIGNSYTKYAATANGGRSTAAVFIAKSTSSGTDALTLTVNTPYFNGTGHTGCSVCTPLAETILTIEEISATTPVGTIVGIGTCNQSAGNCGSGSTSEVLNTTISWKNGDYIASALSVDATQSGSCSWSQPTGLVLPTGESTSGFLFGTSYAVASSATSNSVLTGGSSTCSITWLARTWAEIGVVLTQIQSNVDSQCSSVTTITGTSATVSCSILGVNGDPVLVGMALAYNPEGSNDPNFIFTPAPTDNGGGSDTYTEVGGQGANKQVYTEVFSTTISLTPSPSVITVTGTCNQRITGAGNGACFMYVIEAASGSYTALGAIVATGSCSTTCGNVQLNNTMNPQSANDLLFSVGDPLNCPTGAADSGFLLFTGSNVCISGFGSTSMAQYNTAPGSTKAIFTGTTGQPIYSETVVDLLAKPSPGACQGPTFRSPAAPTSAIYKILVNITNPSTTDTMRAGTNVNVTIPAFNVLHANFGANIEQTGSTVMFLDNTFSPVYSWMENGTETTTTKDTFWLKMNADLAPGATVTYYFIIFNAVTNTFCSTDSNGALFFGVYPNAFSIYGQYDNGKVVFVGYINGLGTTINHNNKVVNAWVAGNYETQGFGSAPTPPSGTYPDCRVTNINGIAINGGNTGNPVQLTCTAGNPQYATGGFFPTYVQWPTSMSVGIGGVLALTSSTYVTDSNYEIVTYVSNCGAVDINGMGVDQSNQGGDATALQIQEVAGSDTFACPPDRYSMNWYSQSAINNAARSGDLRLTGAGGALTATWQYASTYYYGSQSQKYRSILYNASTFTSIFDNTITAADGYVNPLNPLGNPFINPNQGGGFLVPTVGDFGIGYTVYYNFMTMRLAPPVPNTVTLSGVEVVFYTGTTTIVSTSRVTLNNPVTTLIGATTTTITTQNTTVGSASFGGNTYLIMPASTVMYVIYSPFPTPATVNQFGVFVFSNPANIQATLKFGFYIYNPVPFGTNSNATLGNNTLGGGAGSLAFCTVTVPANSGPLLNFCNVKVPVPAGDQVVIAAVSTQTLYVADIIQGPYSPTIYQNFPLTNNLPNPLNLGAQNQATNQNQADFFYNAGGAPYFVITTTSTLIISTSNTAPAPANNGFTIQIYMTLFFIFTLGGLFFFTTRTLNGGIAGFILALTCSVILSYIPSIVLVLEGVLMIVILIRGRGTAAEANFPSGE